MNQKEIIIEVLKKLGGRATNKDIYVLGKYYIGDNSTAQMVENNIRRILNSNPDVFRHPDGVDEGEWELVSYRNEVKELKYKIEQQEEAYNKLMAVPKATDLVEDLVKETMNVGKHERKKADFIRILLRNLGYKDAADVLDAFIEEDEQKLIKALEKLNLRNIYLTGKRAKYIENINTDKLEWHEKSL